MKKIVTIAAVVIFTVAACYMLFTPRQARGSDEKSAIAPGTALPDSVLKLVQRACMDCHADDGSSMARMKLNFSKWNEYSAEKQADKAKDMCKELTKGAMPTKSWRKKNPDAIPTKAEVDMICRWSANLNK